MELHFKNSMADLVAFNIFRAEQSAYLMKRYSIARYAVSVLVGIIPIPLALIGDFPFFLVVSPIFAIITFLIFPKKLRSRLLNSIQKQLEESGAERFLNIPRSLKLEEDSFLSSSDEGMAKYPYSSIAEIAESDTHIFIVVNGGAGYAIPLNRISDNEKNFFTPFVLYFSINSKTVTVVFSVHPLMTMISSFTSAPIINRPGPNASNQPEKVNSSLIAMLPTAV